MYVPLRRCCLNGQQHLQTAQILSQSLTQLLYSTHFPIDLICSHVTLCCSKLTYHFTSQPVSFDGQSCIFMHSRTAPLFRHRAVFPSDAYLPSHQFTIIFASHQPSGWNVILEYLKYINPRNPPITTNTMQKNSRRTHPSFLLAQGDQHFGLPHQQGEGLRRLQLRLLKQHHRTVKSVHTKAAYGSWAV